MPRRKVERVSQIVWVVDGDVMLDGIGPNRSAADATVSAVRGLGRIDAVDAALVATFELLASAVDHDPSNAALWGQYRQAEATLRGIGGDVDDDTFAQFVAGLSPDVRDGEDA